MRRSLVVWFFCLIAGFAVDEAHADTATEPSPAPAAEPAAGAEAPTPTAAADAGDAAAAPAEVKWTTSVGAGAILNSGNSNVAAFSSNLAVTREGPINKIAVEAQGAYARTQNLVAVDRNGDDKLQRIEIMSKSTVSTKNWAAKGRYDHFVGDDNSLFGIYGGGYDPIAGKEMVMNATAGFSRKLVDANRHRLSVEAGYDFSREEYNPATSPAPTGLTIHSVKLAATYNLQLADEVFVKVNVDGLSNLNKEHAPTGDIERLKDVRLNAKVEFSAKVLNNITARFLFEAKYDRVPAPRQPPDTSLPFDGFVLEGEKLNTTTDVSLIVNF